MWCCLVLNGSFILSNFRSMGIADQAYWYWSKLWNPSQSLSHNAAPTTRTYNWALILFVGLCALPIHPTTNWWRMRGHKSFRAFDCKPSPLVFEWIVKSLTIPPSQCGSNDSNLWSGSDTTCQTVCLTNPSNDQLVKDEGAQIFYSIRSQTKFIGIGANCEIPHNFY